MAPPLERPEASTNKTVQKMLTRAKASEWAKSSMHSDARRLPLRGRVGSASGHAVVQIAGDNLTQSILWYLDEDLAIAY
jgi:hypothetical protein